MATLIKRGQHWHIYYDLPPGPDGKRHQTTLSCRGLTKPEAEARMVELERRLSYGIIPEMSYTVKEWATVWMERERLNWTLETYRKYEQVLRLHVLPEIGYIKLADIRPMHIQKLMDKRKGGYAPKTLSSIKGCLHRVFECALKSQLILTNPVNAVSSPKLKRPNVRIGTDVELSQLISKVVGTDVEIPVLIALFTGLRRGELCGLKWEDVDFTEGVMVVRRSITQVKGLVAEKPTKTDAPRRIKLSPTLVSTLRDYKARLEGSGHLTEWLCVKSGGERHTPDSLYHRFYNITRKAGLNLTLHSLRHTQATILIDAGVSVRAVSERLGHSTTTITENLYTHVLPHMQDMAAAVLEDKIRLR